MITKEEMEEAMIEDRLDDAKDMIREEKEHGKSNNNW